MTSGINSVELHFSDFRCPRTGTSLSLVGDQLVSANGEHRYGLNNDIPNFNRYSTAEVESGEEELCTLNRMAEDKGWLEAIRVVYGSDSSMLRYTDTQQRANFLDLLPLERTTTALEIGIGFGQITVPMASRVGLLHAFEVRFQQLLFVRQRCQQLCVNNVVLACGGDDCLLPYPRKLFDVIVLNLVLEWCATRNDEHPGQQGQEVMLSECARVLKPGGTIYLSTKNRFALRLVLGKHDEHAYEMRFGHALPKWAMNLGLRLKGYKKPKGTLHSFSRLSSMLNKAGFVDLRSYWAAPEMRFPNHYVSTDARAISTARRSPGFVQGEYRMTRAVMPLVPGRFVKFVTPGLLFIAKKPSVE